MQVMVNGAEQHIPADSSVQQLLEVLQLRNGRLAIEVNGEIVPRSTFASCTLKDGDTIEIVQAIGGG